MIVETKREGAELVMGILAESVSQVVDLPETAIEPPPAFGTGGHAEYLAGLGKLDDRQFVMILDIDRLLAGLALPALADRTATTIAA